MANEYQIIVHNIHELYKSELFIMLLDTSFLVQKLLTFLFCSLLIFYFIIVIKERKDD
jgi:hypothetical protein